jgi:phosphatidylglycerophosphate synthase
MNAAPERPLRPPELQDPLNIHLYHPLAWRLARLLARTPVTPNAVSVFGGLMVIAAGAAYAGLAWPVSAALGMALHMGWHVVDGADGDLARMTGRANPVGELVDGVCDYVSHIVLYVILTVVLQGQIGWIAWPIAVAAGASHIIQSNHIEVQRRCYQWWFYDKPWLGITHEDAGSDTRATGIGHLVSTYLALGSGVTPATAELDRLKETAQGNPEAAARFKAAVRAEIPRLSMIWRFLGPNPRAIVLGLSMFAGSPLWFFVYQTLVLDVLLVISVRAHNAAWRRVAARMSGGLAE